MADGVEAADEDGAPGSPVEYGLEAGAPLLNPAVPGGPKLLSVGVVPRVAPLTPGVPNWPVVEGDPPGIPGVAPDIPGKAPGVAG
jgi:hypothetical protein